jgi:PAS domain S-box-containing protein
VPDSNETSTGAGTVVEGGCVPVESILCNDELDHRPSRPPDFEVENRALVALAQALADSPETILQVLADTILDVLQAGSAGISLLTKDERRFHWPAIAGIWKPYIGGGTPRDFGPCGDVLDRNIPLMMKRVERRYDYFRPVTPVVEECLLVPFYVQGKAVGTIWAVAHDSGRKFDSEDMRRLVSMARFASLAYQITESLKQLKTNSEDMRASAQRFREMIDALPVAIYTTDAEGDVTHFNQAAAELCGRKPVLGSEKWCVSWKLFRPDGTPLPHDECPMAVALKEGRIVRGKEIIAERPDGTRAWVEPFPTPFFDESGKVAGGINMLVDITARKQAGAAEALLAAIVQSSDDAIISKSLDGIITSWNESAERLFGYTSKEVIGRSISILFPPDRLDEEPRILDRLKRGERVDHFETIRVRKDGSQLAISLTISPLKDATGKIVGASKVARDITELKRARADLREAKEIAEAANKSKDTFLAALSHELRTPLNPVLMTIAAMDMNPELAPAFRGDVAMIRRNVELEVKLIDDLLDLSRVVAGKLTLNMVTVDVNEAVDHVCATCRPYILEKAIHLHCDVPDASFHVKADPARLQQVLWNLLRNAAKFTPDRGDIFVSVSKIDAEHVRIQIRDTGIGIEPDVLPRVFNAFEQGDASITREFGGMGLGLAISKTLTEMHRGTIRAESGGRDRGSIFTVELPIVPAPKHSSAAPAKRERDKKVGLRVLVVDDHADTTLVMSKLLSTYGHKVKTAGSAADALDLAGKEHFDVIVSDIGLPDATGYELMQQIKSRHSMKGIAMSGYGLDEDMRRSREAGFSDHVVKPANVDQLEQTIRRVVGESE